MKNTRTMLTVAGVLLAGSCLFLLGAADHKEAMRLEYVTIRWDGKENTHIIRPGGQVEFIGSELRKAPRPDRADERSFYMNLAMNGLTKDGFEFAGMIDNAIVMRRTVVR
jgi:hypothetical protein